MVTFMVTRSEKGLKASTQKWNTLTSVKIIAIFECSKSLSYELLEDGMEFWDIVPVLFYISRYQNIPSKVGHLIISQKEPNWSLEL